MMNRWEAVVESALARDSYAWLRLKKGRLAAKFWPGIKVGQKVTVSVSPNDVVLCESHPGKTSARNILPGHVRSVKRTPDGVLVGLEVGFPLVALVTQRAVDDLGLKPGKPVYALVKAVGLAPDIAVAAAFRVCLQGARGPILPKEIDFLRSIAEAGSLSEAARELGLNYRTAWMRAQAVNRAWGKPLVAPVRGGRGGGGSSLTLEGKAVLDTASRIERRK
jgi:molybdate transport repressor ModE-like protein/molybdopterin-binding protein